MKVGCVICGPDVAFGPLALLSGTFEEKAQKAAALGYDGIELMVRDPAGLDWQHVKRTSGRSRPADAASRDRRTLRGRRVAPGDAGR